MCCSAFGQILFGGLMLICLGLTLASMFTPGWSKVQKIPGQVIDNQVIPDSFGLFQFSCTFPGQDIGNKNCIQWFDVGYILIWKLIIKVFQNMPNYYKVVVAAMIIAALLEIIALVWNLLTFCACCCKKHILHPLYVLALAVSIFLSIAIAVFYIKNKDIIRK